MDIMLRKWTLDDAQALAALFDALERTYLSNRIPSPYTAADAAAWLETITAREGKVPLPAPFGWTGRWWAIFPSSKKKMFTAKTRKSAISCGVKATQRAS